MKNKSRKKRDYLLINILIFIFASIFIAGAVFLYRRYSYSNEKMDLNIYFGGNKNDVVIYFNDKKLPNEDTFQNEEDKEKSQVNSDEYFEKITAKYNEGSIFLPYNFVKLALNNVFYFAEDEKELLYSGAKETTEFQENSFFQNERAILLDSGLDVNIKIVKDKTDIRYDFYTETDHKRVFIYNNNNTEQYATMKQKENVRFRGGNKSPILTTVEKGDEVKILNKMQKWCLVKTKDGFLGYVRNKKLDTIYDKKIESTFKEEEYSHLKFDKKIVLSYHQLFSQVDDNRLKPLIENNNVINVLCPTWYKIKDNDGNIEDISNNAYVNYCHSRNIQVWPTINNFDIAGVKSKVLFSNTVARKKLINQMKSFIATYNLDGISLDIEDIARESSDDYMQFVRECSIEFRNMGKFLSVCQSIPYDKNDRYCFTDVGKIIDYMVIMAYDEHTKGSEAGPVASIGFIKDAVRLSTSKMDDNRIIYSLPFYTRIWTTDKDGKVTPKAYSAAYFDQNKETLHLDNAIWDPTQGYNYAYTTQGTDLLEVWIEDEKSLLEKMKVIEKANAAGTGAWKLGMELNGFYKIIDLND